MAMKTSFLYPILADTQRWLVYSYYQIKEILSKFPGSSVSRNRNKQLKSIQTKGCIQTLTMINKKLEKSDRNSRLSINQQSS